MEFFGSKQKLQIKDTKKEKENKVNETLEIVNLRVCLQSVLSFCGGQQSRAERDWTEVAASLPFLTVCHLAKVELPGRSPFNVL